MRDFKEWFQSHIPEYDDSNFVGSMEDIAKVAWDACEEKKDKQIEDLERRLAIHIGGCIEQMQFSDRLLKELKEFKNKYRWRSVKDELPEYGENVIGLIKGERYGLLACHDGIVWYDLFNDLENIPVTHWMPLPEKEG